MPSTNLHEHRRAEGDSNQQKERDDGVLLQFTEYRFALMRHVTIVGDRRRFGGEGDELYSSDFHAQEAVAPRFGGRGKVS
jgi:hypothetical protein